MNQIELAKVLARIQAGDNRVVDKVTVAHWRETIGHLKYQDAMDAVVMHFRESTEYLMPAHVIRNARRIRNEREDPNAPVDQATCPHKFIGRDRDCVLCGLIPEEVEA